MSKILWWTFVAIFVLPLVGYFIVNGYWWLFDGNVPNADKMFASLICGFSTSCIAAFWSLEGDIF